MKKILIVDASSYAEVLQGELSLYEVDICNTAFDAVSMLNSRGYDLVISEVELPGDNSFEFYYYMHKNFPYIPVIMITANDMDAYFEEIFKNGIGNVLNSPLDMKEITSLISKLLHESPIFGLENYMDSIIEHKRITLNSSLQINNAINTVTSFIQDEWNLKIQNVMMINLILNEMIINAVYHAHGYTKHKLARRPIRLPLGQHVHITFAHNSNEYAICVTDYMGTLSSSRILESIFNVINQKKVLDQAFQSGDLESIIISESGRGIELVRKLAKEYYFIIHKNKRTDVILKFDSSYQFETKQTASVKIIERN